MKYKKPVKREMTLDGQKPRIVTLSANYLTVRKKWARDGSMLPLWHLFELADKIETGSLHLQGPSEAVELCNKLETMRAEMWNKELSLADAQRDAARLRGILHQIAGVVNLGEQYNFASLPQIVAKLAAKEGAK